MRIISLNHPRELRKVMQDIRVDPYGIKIMNPKATSYLIRLNRISNITANILKQEMLSLGGDVAVARGALTGKIKKTDCLLIGSLSQFNRLNIKLQKQPFGLSNLAFDLSLVLNNFSKDNFTISLGRHKLNIKPQRACIMGILNITPDSFSSDGLYGLSMKEIIDSARKMVDDGADIIDVGGESSRPGAHPVSLKEELKRTIPVIKSLSRKISVPISIDTYKPQVARQALDNGAVLVNDITGLRDTKMQKIIARYKSGVVIMHMKGRPFNMQNDPQYTSLIEEIIGYLGKAIKQAEEIGIDREKIIIDPGIGFGKTFEHNLEILNHLKEFKVLGRPILVGTSRKSFLGKILKAKPQDRIFATVSSCVLAVKNGANMVRVHDVKPVKQALMVLERIGARC